LIYTYLYPVLSEWVSGFNVLQYTTVRVAYAAITALVFSLIIGPGVIKLLIRLKAGQEIRSCGPETHLVKQGTPTMGGVMIIMGLALSILLWMDLENPITWMFFTALVGYGAIGFADDYLKIILPFFWCGSICIRENLQPISICLS